MADYVPSTVVKVLKNVPLDDTYTDTRWFSSTGEQTGFFSGKAKYTFTDMTYQRVNNGIAQPRVALTCRVPRIADDLYDCNYIMFQNSNYGTKWFYAFIKQVNYINPNNTEIVYEIDYLQTFMFEIKIKASFVEREHASASEDKPFYNLTPEPIEVPKWCEDKSRHYRLDMSDVGLAHKHWIVFAVVPNSLITSLLGQGAIYCGIYSGAVYMAYDNATQANAFIESLALLNQADAIVDVFMSPAVPTEADSAQRYPVDTGINLKAEDFVTPTGTYKIRNKKLLNSQFTYIKGSSDTGSERTWEPELCVGDTFGGYLRAATVPTLSMYFTPAYMAYSGANLETVEYGLSFDQAVHCTWNSYGWLGKFVDDALKFSTLALAPVAAPGAVAATAGASATTALTTTAPAGTALANAGSSAMSQAYNIGTYTPYFGASWMAAHDPGNYSIQGATRNSATILGDMSSLLSYKASTARGSFAGDAMGFAMDLHGFEFRRMCPDKDTLEKLDTFFDMFGYQVNKVKIPNLDTRVAWNYVKLNSPCIYGSVPVEGMEIIKTAFTNGIRLWHVDAVGDYSIENPAK
jgi:hypothetical protein